MFLLAPGGGTVAKRVVSVQRQYPREGGWLVNWCLTALSAQTGYIVPQEYEIYHVGLGTNTQ